MIVSTILVNLKYPNRLQESKYKNKSKKLMDHLDSLRCQIQMLKNLTQIRIFLNKYRIKQI